MSLTCSSNQVHNSADVFGSFAVAVAFPTRAHGMRNLQKKSGVRTVGDSRRTTQFISPCHSTLPLVALWQPIVVSARHMGLDIGW